MPMHFEPVAEGSESTAHYFSRGPGYVAAIEPDGARLYLHRSAPAKKASLPRAGEGLKRGQFRPQAKTAEVKLELIGANPHAKLTPLDPLASYSNYLAGSDASKWRPHVPHFGRVKSESVYPGIDIVYYGNDEKLEYDFMVAPGADPSAISLRYGDAKGLRIDERGDLVLSLTDGELVQHKPIVYQERNGERHSIDGRYRLEPDQTVAFDLEGYDRQLALVIDPVITYSTYFGDAASDFVDEMARDGAGSIYILGSCSDSRCREFGGQPRFVGADENGPFVAKFAETPAGGISLVYVTFFGSGTGEGIAVDSTGSAYIAGYASSGEQFPTVPAQQAHGGRDDVFVSKLTPDGSQLVYSRLIGASGDDRAFDLALDGQRNAYITGSTTSTGFPVTQGVFQPTLSDSSDVFVTKLSPDGGTLLYSTFIGGTSVDTGEAIAVDSSGKAYVGGLSRSSTTFPTVNPIEPTGSEGFALRLNATATALDYSTHVSRFEVVDLVLDAGGTVFILGEATNNDPGGTRSTDVALDKITPSGGAGNFPIRFLGGTATEHAFAIALDAQGNVYLGGDTRSADFPRIDSLPGTDGNIQTASSTDAFVTKLSPYGTILFSSYISGEGDESVLDLVTDSQQNIYAVGETLSNEFPIRNAFDSSRANRDGFLLKISDQAPASQLQFVQTAAQIAESGVMVTLEVSRTGSTSGAVSVSFNTAPGTATAGTDYVSVTNGTLTWANGDGANKTLQVMVVNDTAVEGNETFNVTLSSPSAGAVIGTNSTAIVTITDDDTATPASLAFNQAAVSVNEAGGSVSLTVTRGGDTAAAVTVAYTTVAGAASATADFTSSSGTLSFASGVTSQSFSIPIVSDVADEPDETFTVQLSNPGGGAVLGVPSAATVTILDDDDAPAPGMPGALAISAASFTAGESAGSVTILVNRTGGSSGAISVSYATVAGSATAPADFNSASGSLSFADGETSKSFMVPIVNDSQSEGSETFSVQLSNPTGGASLGSPSTATVTITDDDLTAAGTLALSSAAFSTSESGGNVTITVNRSGGSSGAVAVSYATAPGTATAGDFTAASGSVTFADGETSKTFTVGIINDAINETNESFSVSLSSPTNGASLGTPSTATVTIMDDDAGPAGALAFSAGAFTVNEAAGGLNITVMRSGGSTGVVSVNFAAAAGSAGNTDFTPTAGTLTFADGETSKSFAVSIVNDSLDEPAESFTLQLSMPAGGASLGSPSSATVTIVDDDLPAPVPGSAACGPANGSTLPSFPSGGLCAPGSSTTTDFFGSDGNFNWTCAANNGSAAPCSAINVNVATINGTCGPAASPAQPGQFPANGHCAAGIFVVTDTDGRDGAFDWQCLGRNGGNGVACTAPIPNQGPANGVCGAADGTGSTSFPANGLCGFGMFQAIDSIAGDGSFNWSCSGFNGGAPAVCFSAKTGAATSPVPGPGTGSSFRNSGGGGSFGGLNILAFAVAAMVRRRFLRGELIPWLGRPSLPI